MYREEQEILFIPMIDKCARLTKTSDLDKQSLSYASVVGLIDDLHLAGTQFSWTSSIFYFGRFIH